MTEGARGFREAQTQSRVISTLGTVCIHGITRIKREQYSYKKTIED